MKNIELIARRLTIHSSEATTRFGAASGPTSGTTGGFARTTFLAIACVLALTSCGRTKVTEAQCDELLKQEIKFSMKNMFRPGGTIDDFLAAAKYGDPRSCAKGTTKYERADYDCILSAKTDPETKMCLDKAHQRIDRSR
jgi:hypothetical protein